jgi:hypothetical protein
MILGLLVAAEVVRLSPEAAEAARRDGEARAIEMYAREDAARAAKHGPRGFASGGIGTRELSRAHAPLGDVGQAGFVYLPGSIGYSRYRDN